MNIILKLDIQCIFSTIFSEWENIRKNSKITHFYMCIFSGIISISDITYEVVLGYIPLEAIIEIIENEQTQK